VTRYEDVRAALADPRLSLDKAHATEGNYRGLSLPPALDANLLNMDPPDHTRIRRLVARAFTMRRVEQLRIPIRRTADRLLDALGPHGTTDLIAAYAGPLPITVICDLLGVPEDHRRDFRAWTDALVAPDPARPAAVKEAVGAMLGFFTGLIAAKRAAPADDLLSDLIAVRDEGDRLTEDELMSLAFLILFAGYENTVQLIGNAVLSLLNHPEQLAALRADPARIPAAVEEFARYEGPALLAIRRFPTQDVTIGGVTVPAGETVLLSLAAANRDPARFTDPDRLDLGRDTSGHLALGHGIHHCLGAPLARAETEIALAGRLQQLLRFPGPNRSSRPPQGP
jgi:cytochrome P450